MPDSKNKYLGRLRSSKKKRNFQNKVVNKKKNENKKKDENKDVNNENKITKKISKRYVKNKEKLKTKEKLKASEGNVQVGTKRPRSNSISGRLENGKIIEESITLNSRSYIYKGNDVNLIKEKHGWLTKTAVISTEASANFSKKYGELMLGKEATSRMFNFLEKKPSNFDSIFSKYKDVLINKNKITKARDFNGFINDFFEFKDIPHVIVIVESGSREFPEEFNLNHGGCNYLYDMKVSDINSKIKQNMTAYLRRDMGKVYTVGVESVDVNNVLNTKCISVSYNLIKSNSKEQRVSKELIVHLPNKQAAGNKELMDNCIKAFQSHANQPKSKGAQYIAFHGDTNFSSALSARNLPSVGGNIKYGENTFTFAPASSGSEKFTTFMQSNVISPPDDVIVYQPSALNFVQASTGLFGKHVAVDHPSMLCRVFHNGWRPKGM
ncbi:hypothetical protein EAG18_07275 [Pseudoalteromonas sp. J010]|uniref:hypothetical protein n=1 Tax=Pseudoalteromonas sp. J010 TaxID=998465 RepID=UPI000F647638|nr:hypothetical protein [Pseudoalteromonas sp. J010]RRS09236.1 hypothetical protein EAG18_07275 [Pseudoalteromonas sp. J010]